MNGHDPVAELAAHAGPIVFGEIHGTNEIPALVGAVVERARRDGRATQLGLEMPPSALEPGRTGWFWASHDGRSSAAMAALVDRAREHGATVVGLEPEHLSADEFDRHEVVTAERLVAVARAHPDAFTIALVGNGHSCADADVSYYATPPMAALASAQLPTLRTVRFELDGGTAWVMNERNPQGGEIALPRTGAANTVGLHWHDGLHEHHHATWAIGPVTASGPARRR